MQVLSASNNVCTRLCPQTFTSLPYAAGVSTVKVGDVSNFTAGDRVLLGQLGTEGAELLQVQSVSTSNVTLTFTSNLLKAHSESTSVIALHYDQVRWYWAATASSGAATALTAFTDIDPTSFYSTYDDAQHQTGYGFFQLYHSTKQYLSSFSNPVPYAGFSESSVKAAIDHFYSQINQAQARLVSREDVLRYLNEAYTIARAELNLVNANYYASDEVEQVITPGIMEYALPDRFSDMVYVRKKDSSNELLPTEVASIPQWINQQMDTKWFSRAEPKYYIRGNMLGIVPMPQESYAVQYRYDQLKTPLVSDYDTIDLPDQNFYCLVDYALWKSAVKRNAPGQGHFQAWRNGIDTMKIVSVNRSSRGASWSADWGAIS